MQVLNTVTGYLQAGLDALASLLGGLPGLGEAYTTGVRYVLPVLAVLILTTAIRSLLSVRHTAEIWAYLNLEDGRRIPLTHWENIVGRQSTADVVLDHPTVSRNHAALIRSDGGDWTVYDLDSKSGTKVDGHPVVEAASVRFGQTLSFAGVQARLQDISAEEQSIQRRLRAQEDRPVPPWGLLVLMTFFQVLTCLQLIVAENGAVPVSLPLTFLALTALMWCYCLTLRAFHQVGFEMEMIAFFLSTLSLSITASSNVNAVPKQFFAVLAGVLVFLILGIFLRDLDHARAIRWLMSAGAIGLLGITLVLGQAKFGAQNWISIGGFSLQPSELAKICYIFAGSATLDRLFRKRNLGLFIVLTFACLGCLALMSDFGTAAIFFITFLVIGFLRSGDWATLGIISGGCGAAIMVVLSVKPYIMRRFAIWGHVWEDAANLGYQQTRTMSAAASGGLVGVGAGNGWLQAIGAADTDLVFGMLCEEFGLIIAALAILCIVTLCVFSARATRAGRSSFYTIAACAASSMMVFQTCLNVFGAVDILPLTGVTFPFVSNGGTAMMASWGLLAFLKATDTRQNASFAIRRKNKKQHRRLEDSMPLDTADELVDQAQAPVFPEEPESVPGQSGAPVWEDPIRAPLWDTGDLGSEWHDPVIDFDGLDEEDDAEDGTDDIDGEEDDDA